MMLSKKSPFAIRVCSQKGGQGKTVISVNFAIALRTLGYKVLLIDVDPFSGGITNYLGLQEPEVSFTDILYKGLDPHEGISHYKDGNIDIIYGKVNFEPYNPTSELVDKMALRMLELDYDFIISDSAPGNMVLPVVKYYNEFMDVVEPVRYSVHSEARLIEQYKTLKLKYRVVLNYTEEQMDSELSIGEVEDMLSGKIDAIMPYDRKVEEGARRHMPVYLLDRNSKFSVGIRELAKLYM